MDSGFQPAVQGANFLQCLLFQGGRKKRAQNESLSVSEILTRMHNGLLSPSLVTEFASATKGNGISCLSKASNLFWFFLFSLEAGRGGTTHHLPGSCIQGGAGEAEWPSLSPGCLLWGGTKRREGHGEAPQELFPPCTESLISVCHPQPPLNQVIGMYRLISSSVWHAQQTDQLWHMYSWANLARRCFSRCSGASHPSAAILMCLFI